MSFFSDDESPLDFVARRQQELDMERAFREVKTEILEALQELYRQHPRAGDKRAYEIVQRELRRREAP